MSSSERLYFLLQQYCQDRASSAEKLELAQWLKETGDGELEEILLPMAMGQELIFHSGKEEQLLAVQAILNKASQSVFSPAKTVHRIHFLRTAWFRVAVIILLFSVIGAYLWQTNRSNPASTDEALAKPVQNDVMPGSDKAILTLSDGKKVKLDSAASETITDGQLAIKNVNGQLFYTNTDVAAMNTMATPKGGQYQLTLSDGTRVWLNAASSITYPAAFTGSTREVSITGEAYLDVKPEKQRPFIIKTKDQKIEVLGTELNVHTYEDEKVKISLVNGAIKINNKVLKPGEALMDGNIQPTNIDQDIGWKNGQFSFVKADVAAVMRQLSRWYNIDVIFKGAPQNTWITGKMGRELTLLQVIKILKTLGVNCRLQNNQLIVLQ